MNTLGRACLVIMLICMVMMITEDPVPWYIPIVVIPVLGGVFIVLGGECNE